MPKDALFDLSKPRKRKPEEIAILDQLVEAGLPEPEQEFSFAKAIGRNWRFDFAWPFYKIALEIEGALFGGRVINVGAGAFEYRTIRGVKQHVPVVGIVRLGGRHNTGAGQVADMEKYNHAAILGWCVVKATTTMVRDFQVVPFVQLAFRHRGVIVAPLAPRRPHPDMPF
jgi:hypothetical protein